MVKAAINTKKKKILSPPTAKQKPAINHTGNYNLLPTLGIQQDRRLNFLAIVYYSNGRTQNRQT